MFNIYVLIRETSVLNSDTDVYPIERNIITKKTKPN